VRRLTGRHPSPDGEDLGRGAIDSEIRKDLAEQSRDENGARTLSP
jgi:hypothetical protein